MLAFQNVSCQTLRRCRWNLVQEKVPLPGAYNSPSMSDWISSHSQVWPQEMNELSGWDSRANHKCSPRIMKTLQQFPLEWSKIPRISLECMSLASIVFAWMPLRIMNQCMRASFLTLRESLPNWCPKTSILANSHNFTTESCKAPWLPQKK